MGVSKHHVVLYGYRIPYDKYDFEDCEPYYFKDRSEGEVAVVADGRSGEYLFVGVLQAKSDDARYGEASLSLMEITNPSAPQCTRLGRAIEELGYSPDGEPSHYVFTHYS